MIFTGSVSAISVEEGEEVLEGAEVAVVVAMKMNNSLKVWNTFLVLLYGGGAQQLMHGTH